RGFGGFLVVGLQLVFEQALQLMRIEVAAGDQPQAVNDELHHVMVGHHTRVLLEDVALLRVLDVPLDGEHAVATRHHQDLVHQLEQLDVLGLAIADALEQTQRATEGGLDHLQRIADQERAQRAADDDHHFEGMPEEQQAAAAGHEAAEHRAQYDQCSDDCKHLTSSAASIHSEMIIGSCPPALQDGRHDWRYREKKTRR